MSVLGGADTTILHADPDEEVQQQVAAGLGDIGADVSVEAVTTGEAAVSRYEEDEIDCLVSEYQLPDMDGLELLEQVRTTAPSVPFVVCTDSGSEAVASDAFSAGATDYITKDDGIDVQALSTTVVEAIEKARRRKAIEEREERYSTLVEGSHDGIYIYQHNEFQFVNDRVCEVTGYSREELHEMEIWELIHPEDRDRIQTIGQRRARGEEAPNTYDARIVTKDDEIRYVEFSVESVTYDGEWAALGSARDVTARREREQDLQAEQEFVQTILDTLEDVVFVCSLDGEMLRWNERLCEVTGYSDEALSEMTVFELVPDEYEANIDEAIRGVESSGVGSVEGEALTTHGERVPFEFRGSPLTNNDGEVIGVAGVARDVSDRRAREQELTQYRTIVEAVGDPVYTIDSDGYFTLVNEALADMTGHSGNELVGEHVSKVMRDQDVETAQGLIEEILKSEQRQNATFEMEAITTAGEHIPCEDHIALLPSGDGFGGTAGVVRDISDRKEREKRLRRQNERLDQFAGVVSHDLRNPLNVIMGRLEHARLTGEEEHLDAIERAGRRMERLIDDLLTLAREGQTVGDVEPVAFESAVRAAWQNVETEGASLSVSDDVGTVLADRDRLASLLENLFRNAVEHGSTDDQNATRSGDAVEHGVNTPESQTQRATVERGPTESDTAGQGSERGTPTVKVEVGGTADTSEAGFYVADDGPGIPPEEREKVFEHGYSNSDSGTGLGLVIVDGIADAHDWAVDVTESETGGARFDITDVDRFQN